MADDFLNDLSDDEFAEDAPDWAQELETEEPGDEFDQLRRKSARTGSIYDDMELDEESDSSSSPLSNFSPTQGLILAVLVLLNIVVFVVGVLALTNRIG